MALANVEVGQGKNLAECLGVEMTIGNCHLTRKVPNTVRVSGIELLDQPCIACPEKLERQRGGEHLNHGGLTSNGEPINQPLEERPTQPWANPAELNQQDFYHAVAREVTVDEEPLLALSDRAQVLDQVITVDSVPRRYKIDVGNQLLVSYGEIGHLRIDSDGQTPILIERRKRNQDLINQLISNGQYDLIGLISNPLIKGRARIRFFLDYQPPIQLRIKFGPTGELSRHTQTDSLAHLLVDANLLGELCCLVLIHEISFVQPNHLDYP